MEYEVQREVLPKEEEVGHEAPHLVRVRVTGEIRQCQVSIIIT